MDKQYELEDEEVGMKPAVKLAIAGGIVIMMIAVIVLIYYMSSGTTTKAPTGTGTGTGAGTGTVAAAVAKFAGCFIDDKHDGKDRGATIHGGTTIAQCRDYAKSVGANAFAIRAPIAGKPGYFECWTDASSTLNRFTQYGATDASKCVAVTDADSTSAVSTPFYGTDWNSAVYTVA